MKHTLNIILYSFIIYDLFGWHCPRKDGTQPQIGITLKSGVFRPTPFPGRVSILLNRDSKAGPDLVYLSSFHIIRETIEFSSLNPTCLSLKAFILVGVDIMHKWNPEAYERISLEHKRWAKEAISKIRIKGNERVLDIGCGDGKITAYISSLVPQGSVVGIDNSVDMIGFAQSKFPKSSWPNLSFQYGDATDLPYKDEFDLVVSFACLHWILDQKPVLKGIRQSLKSKGRLLFQFGGRGNVSEVLDIVNKEISEDKWAGYFKNFTFRYGFFGPEEYQGWLVQAGLRPKRVELIPKDMVQPGIKGLECWLESTWIPYIERIPDNLQRDFISEIAKDYISTHSLDSGGCVHVKMVRIEVEAEKA